VLEEAARRYGAQIEVRWHAYELRPEPLPLPDPDSDYIQEHWANRVGPMASERGLVMRVPRRQVRSRRALQAALFARRNGCLAELDRAIYRARFEDDADISDLAVLKRLATAAGLDPDALSRALAANVHVGDLNADLTLAGQLGISGVPAAFIGPEADGLFAFFSTAEPVVGAVPFDWFAAAIDRALSRPGTPA
jgi:predicted DsbA family dithiol-disulfide isomerase